MSFQADYQKLNPEQREAVDKIDGPLLVVAGPGTGKTQLLSLRVANILDKTDTEAKNILCLTFTDSASFNMRQRLYTVIGNLAYKVAIHTFHSFSTEIINQNPEYFFFGANFKPADELSKIAIFQDIFENLEFNNPLRSKYLDTWTYLSAVKSRITDLKQDGLEPDDFREILKENQDFFEKTKPILLASSFQNLKGCKLIDFENFYNQITEILVSENRPQSQHQSFGKKFISALENLKQILLQQTKFSSIPISNFKKIWFTTTKQGVFFKDEMSQEKLYSLAFIYEKYQLAMHQQGLYDFDDMLLEVLKAFRNNFELQAKYQEKFLYIMVDEFQDTNGVQSKIIDSLLNLEITEGNPNIMVVGDDDQAIFKFQKASLENILFFTKKYRTINTITLTKNYRSNQEILDFVDKIIQNNESRLTHLPGINKKLVAVS